jgi:hypothetical protein
MTPRGDDPGHKGWADGPLPCERHISSKFRARFRFFAQNIDIYRENDFRIGGLGLAMWKVLRIGKTCLFLVQDAAQRVA